MKTTDDFNRLIDEEAAAIYKLRHDFETAEFKDRDQQARAYKIMRKEVGKRNDEIARLRRLAVFAETVSEEGVRLMVDRLQANVSAVTASAKQMFDPEGDGKNKRLIQQYLTNSQIPLKKRQIAEL
jgi:hypothetical protein|nr:MAG TPA: hypothetical protein [Caudoviricetes sp.]